MNHILWFQEANNIKKINFDWTFWLRNFFFPIEIQKKVSNPKKKKQIKSLNFCIICVISVWCNFVNLFFNALLISWKHKIINIRAVSSTLIHIHTSIILYYFYFYILCIILCSLVQKCWSLKGIFHSIYWFVMD